MSQKFTEKFIPLILTVITFLVIAISFILFLHVLNLFPVKDKISYLFRPVDILVGMTIYLKTSIDFALFMGNLMHSNPGWKKRIAIELGTALGNCLGTVLVLCIWFFFKEAPVLMIIMIIIASFILFKMAEEGFEEIAEKKIRYKKFLSFPIWVLQTINLLFKPVLNKLLPDKKISSPKLSFSKLFFFSLTIPFLLGLDDFAGYIPLFSVVNVMSFVLGVFLAHMLLNIGLFASPHLTTKVTKHPFVIILGSIAFLGIGAWGLIEAVQILIRFF
jgi:hypothetical protein